MIIANLTFHPDGTMNNKEIAKAVHEILTGIDVRNERQIPETSMNNGKKPRSAVNVHILFATVGDHMERRLHIDIRTNREYWNQNHTMHAQVLLDQLRLMQPDLKDQMTLSVSRIAGMRG